MELNKYTVISKKYCPIFKPESTTFSLFDEAILIIETSQTRKKLPGIFELSVLIIEV